MEKESIYITDGIENASLSLHYIGISGDSLSNVGLLNIDITTSVNRENVEKLREKFVEAHTLPIRAECSVKEQSWNILYDSPASVI